MGPRRAFEAKRRVAIHQALFVLQIIEIMCSKFKGIQKESWRSKKKSEEECPKMFCLL